jgi:hypothetical protein
MKRRKQLAVENGVGKQENGSVLLRIPDHLWSE